MARDGGAEGGDLGGSFMDFDGERMRKEGRWEALNHKVTDAPLAQCAQMDC